MFIYKRTCFFLFFLALILTFTSAERQYFNESQQLTWDEARSYCQVCYKDLVALTSDNVQVIIKMIDTDHWIGLRKHFPKNVTDKNNFTSDSNFTSNDNFTYDKGSKSNFSNIDSIINIFNNTNITGRPPCKTWCKWSNGDPLVFQNWHPGMPVFKSRLPEIKCCSCSCTCPGSTTRVTTRLAPFTESPTVQTSVMYSPPESTGQSEITKASEGTTGETYHVPSTPSAASGKTEARTTQMSSTITTNQEEITTKEEKTTKPTNQNIFLSCTMKERTNQEGLTTNQEGLSTARESTTDTKHFRQTTDQEGISTARESTMDTKYSRQTSSQEGISTAGESVTKVGDLSVTTTQEGISASRESVTKVDPSVTTTQEGISASRESVTNITDLSVTTTQVRISASRESVTKVGDLSVTTTQEGISASRESVTKVGDLSVTTTQEGLRTAGESTTKVGDLSVTTTQEGISTAGQSVTKVGDLSVTTTQEGISASRESVTKVDPSVTTTQEGISASRESVTNITDLSVTTTQVRISASRKSVTKVGDLSVTTTQEGVGASRESVTKLGDLSVTTTQEGISASRESVTKVGDLSVTTTQEGLRTAGESTTKVGDLSVTTTQEGISASRESVTKVDPSVTTTQEGISASRESVTNITDLSVTTTQVVISASRESVTKVGDLSVTTTQEGISASRASLTKVGDLSVTTTQEGISASKESVTNLGDLSVTTTQEGIGTAGEGTAKIGDLSVTTTQEGFSTAGESTTHWKSCETTNQETFLTCKVVESTPDTGNCFKTTTPGEDISTVSDSTTVTENSFTTDQEQKSPFQTNISFTTDKITHSPVSQDTTGKTTDQQTPVTSTKSTTTFDVFESSTGSLWTTTLPSSEATCEQSPVEIPLLAEINENYIEDSCVVITSFGPWIEMSCSEILPFICYEDRFFGQVNVTNVTSGSATLTWLPGPGGISHYDVEVTGDIELYENVTDLTLDLFNLTAGSHYKVQVFPVKCDRRLNPQNASFYTKPFRINDLKVENITERSVFLSWREPHGKADLYIVETKNRSEKVKTTNVEVKELTPGICYTFAVNTAVQDESEESEESSIIGCTKPAKVSNLKVTNITVSSLTVSWEKPDGFFIGFNVTVSTTTNKTYNVSTPETELTLTNLPSGTKIDISVRALSNHSLMGDVTNITNYTAPLEVTDVILTAGNDSIKTTWKHAGGSGVTFVIEVWHEVKLFEMNTTLLEVNITKLNSSTNYTVFVHAVSGNIPGPTRSKSSFTLPTPPSNVRITFDSNDSLTLQWDAPDKITKATYIINVTSIWNSSYEEEVKDTTTKNFTGLISGTNYTFEVYTVAGDIRSSPAVCYGFTVPEKTEISLSMLCSSAEMADCANLHLSLVKELRDFLQKEIGKKVFWEFLEPNN
ncbi:fibronectin-like isoform X1 [Oryzias latipes]|uniref:fibronectin-like isoform X1 n=2 Tax=Oryzias latipes TaxID=8090 RepID=UPI000CE19C8F|nr:fibronectin-like isoform X1 [Oryzias latipes]